MAAGVFNICKGRVVELYNRVANNDPTNSQFIISLWTGAGTAAVLKDLNDIAAIQADAGFLESADGGYARKVLHPGSTPAIAALPTPVDAFDRYDVDMPNQTWTALTGESLTYLIVGYDSDSLAGTDANILPVCWYDFLVTTDGNDVVAQVNAQGFFTAGE